MINLNRSLQIFFWSYAFIYVVLCSLQITQIDLWYQLAEGFHILHTWTLPTAPAAAFGIPASPYIDEYAGYEVVLALLYKIGGLPGLWLVFAAIYVAIVFLPIATSGRTYPVFDFSSTIALFFAGIIMRERLEQRPELVAGLLLVLLMVVLRKSQLEKIPARTLVALFFLFLAWSNTHSTFVIGFFTLGLWLACEIFLKYRTVPIPVLVRSALAMGGVALIASMLNPYGPWRLLFPFEQAFDPGATALSPEMWPITDVNSVARGLTLITLALLAWGILTTRGVPLWLILFSVFAVFISFKSLRFINFLAISTLFVYAARTESTKTTSSLPLVLLKDAMLCLLCIFLIFDDATTFLSTYEEQRAENRLATHTRRFAEDICAMKVTDSTIRAPVLCDHGVGSYLSFGPTQFRPLLDSGLIHFTDDTKRYFFFLWQKPEAFDIALRNLHVEYVIINRETFAWAPTLHHEADWELVTCDETGMLWKRSPNGPHSLSAANLELVRNTMRTLQAKGDSLGAFAYSTLLDDPAQSLDILERYEGSDWRELVFTYMNAWIDALPPSTVESYLVGNHPRQYPLIDAMLSARLGPDVLKKFIETNPPGPRPWFWTALQARACMQTNDPATAKTLFHTIYPAPISSVTYYELWNDLRKSGEPGPGSYGQWQTWDDDAKRFEETMSSRLNDRIAELNGGSTP